MRHRIRHWEIISLWKQGCVFYFSSYKISIITLENICNSSGPLHVFQAPHLGFTKIYPWLNSSDNRGSFQREGVPFECSPRVVSPRRWWKAVTSYSSSIISNCFHSKEATRQNIFPRTLLMNSSQQRQGGEGEQSGYFGFSCISARSYNPQL